MASDGNPVKIPAASLVHGSQAQKVAVPNQEFSGKSLPVSGKAAPGAVPRIVATGQAAVRPKAPQSVEALVAQLNKSLNNSGRPDQFRLAPNSGNTLIQQVNPATGEVIGEFPVAEFPALARSVGVSGVVVDDRA